MFHPRGPTFYELMVQALSSTERGYDLLARKFDYTPFRTPDSMLVACAPFVERIAPARSLDICCGTGAAMRMLRPYTRDVVAGVDVSRGMLEEARRRWRDEGPPPAGTRDPRLALLRGDALSMPIADASIDAATCYGAFGHILEEDEPRFCDEVKRVLRPGGAFVFITSDMPPLSSPAYWIARGFNAAIRVRNAVLQPKFIMYYLTFLLPRAQALLEQRGFRVEVHRDVVPAPFQRAIVVVATRGARP